MPFQNVIMPGTTVGDMHGLMHLLALIGNPKAKEAADFLQKLSDEKDAAIEAARQAATDRTSAEEATATAKALHVDMVDRLSKTEMDLRAKIDAHSKAAASLQQREDDLRVRKTAHESAVAAHKKEVEAAKTSHDVREASLKEREQNLAKAHADLQQRTAKFNEHMAPVLAAATLAGGM